MIRDVENSKLAPTWLVTGGAGYIGAHVLDNFLSYGLRVVAYDSLINSTRNRIKHLEEKHKQEVPLIVEDIRDEKNLTSTLKKYSVSGIIHLAALKSVQDSISHPSEYFDVNYHGTQTVIKAAEEKSVDELIFGSTAAVYGETNLSKLISENDFATPINPYVESKLLAEKLVSEYGNRIKGKTTSFRFFNVIGQGDENLFDTSIDNLVSIVFRKFLEKQEPEIYGSDYPTPDGTCIRDFVDVRDIAKAIYFAAIKVGALPPAINIGTGIGVSVREVVASIADSLNILNYKVKISPRRPGNPAVVSADNNSAKHVLGMTQYHSFGDPSQHSSLHIGEKVEKIIGL